MLIGEQASKPFLSHESAGCTIPFPSFMREPAAIGSEVISMGRSRMARATISAPAGAASASQTGKRIVAVIAWTGIIGLAVAFAFRYVLFYYRH
jgi:hypothetical protein